MARTSVLLLALACSAPSAPSAQSVLVVDASGMSGGFSSIAQAVLAASPGDTLLVKSGSYPSLIFSKPLTVVADEGAAVDFTAIQVGGAPAGTRSVVRGFTAGFVTAAGAVDLWLEDVTATGSYAEFDGLAINSSASVVAASCTFVGGAADPSGTVPFPGHGVFVHASPDVCLYDTAAIGGAGRDAVAGPGGADAGDGGPGILCWGDRLVLVDSAAVGGQGGAADVSALPCGAPGDGGVGFLYGAWPGSPVYELDAAFAGGAPGFLGTPSVACSPPPGATGAPIDGALGAMPISLGNAVPLRCTASSPVRTGKQVRIDLSGQPAALSFLGVGAWDPPSTLLPTLAGSLVVESPFAVVALGVLDGAGQLTVQLPVGGLPAGVQARNYFVQSGYVLGGAAVLGEPSVTTVIDASF